MPAPTTTGGAIMSYPSTVDTGLIGPSYIGAEAAMSIAAANITLTANKVYVYAFETNAPITITAMRWRMGATTTGTTNMGIYTLAGNLVAGSDTGAQTNSANVTNTFTYTTPIQLGPGQYLLALGCSNSTDTYDVNQIASQNLTRHRIAANSIAAAALPATTGALSNTGNMIAMAAILSGGLS